MFANFTRKLICDDSDRGPTADLLQLARSNLVRLGHPARIHPVTLPHSLETRINTHEDTAIVQDIRRELDTLRSAAAAAGGKGRHRTPISVQSSGLLDKKTGEAVSLTTKRDIRTELKTVRHELRTRELLVTQNILQEARVVCATCIGAASHLLKDVSFDLVIVDEAAQCLEAATWIPILRTGHPPSDQRQLHNQQQNQRKGKGGGVFGASLREGGKCVLAGDHCQLPPTVKSSVAAQAGLDKTLFERIAHFRQPSSSDAADKDGKYLIPTHRLDGDFLYTFIV